MIRKIQASDWKSGSAGKGEELTYDLPAGAIVEVGFRSEKEGVLHAVTSDGELVYLDSGRDFNFRSRLDGFSGLSLRVAGTYAVRAVCEGSDEYVDPTVMVHTVLPQIDPARQALKAELQEYLEKLRIDGLFKDDVEVAELAEDFVDGDLEFEEPDDWGLTAAAEAEEERQFKLRQLPAEDTAEGLTPPAGDKQAPEGPVPAQAVKPATPA